MLNTEMFNQSYTDLILILYDATGSIAEESNWNEISEKLSVINDLTTIIKRMGETQILEINNNEPMEGDNQ